MEYRVAIIGAGPGGYVAALKAAELGLKVCLIEQDEVGGVCLNWGCIPTKTLVASAKILTQIQKAAEYGITVNRPTVDWAKVLERKSGVVKRLVSGINYLLQQGKVDLVRGKVAFDGEHRLRVTTDEGERIVEAESVIVATGSSPAVPQLFGFDGKQVITSNEALELPELPESLIIVGGGVIGCEFASFMAAFGVKVTIVEMMERILPMVDPEVSSALRLQFKKKGIAVITGTAVSAVEKSPEQVRVKLANGQEFTGSKVLVAIGRRPNSTGLNLEEVGVTVAPNRRIPVNSFLQTNLPWIYAIGDVNDRPFDLAHAASFQGVCAVEHLAGKGGEWSEPAVPNCIFTDPEVAAVGLTVSEAEAHGIPTVTAKHFFLANGKAQAQGEAVGFVKTIANSETKELVGTQIIGPGASDLIGEAAVAIDRKLSLPELVRVVHAHPTLAESFHEACVEALRLIKE